MDNGFKKCQLCGHTADDICEFRMWQKTNKQDKPIDDYLITCKSDKCDEQIEDHADLFIEVPWSAGGPGKFMLICGNCPHREKFTCKHPDLKTNGGKGLEVKLSHTPLSGVLCISGTKNGKPWSKQNPFPMPATSCIGNPNGRE